MEEDGKPVRRTVTVSFTHGIEQRDVVRRRRKHGDEVVKAGQIQFANRTGARLLDQELAAALGVEPADDLELRLGETEAFDVIVALCSTMVRPIGWVSTSDGLWVSKMPRPFCLRMVFCCCLAKSVNASWSRTFQNSEIT